MEYIAGVFVPIPRDVARQITKAKKKLGLEYMGNYQDGAHLTFYFARFNRRNFSKFVEALRTAKIKSFPVVLSGITHQYNKLRDNEFLSMGVVNKAALRKVHKKILLLANGYRPDLMREKDKNAIRRGLLSAKERRYVETYGYQRVLDLFHPTLPWVKFLGTSLRQRSVN